MKPVNTLKELRKLSRNDPRYEKLAITVSCRLGGRDELPLADHLEWLRIYAMATTEQDVVDQVNCGIDQIGEQADAGSGADTGK
ncbi:MAG: hypothetical protein ACYTG0_19990 [Planctomycetota bacterium]|jgi:hypothetical protein